MTGGRSTLADDVDELTVLAPALRGALGRDQGAAEGERVSTSRAFGLPVNADVLRALDVLASVPSIAWWAANVVGEPHNAARGLLDHLRHFPRQHERMLVTAAAEQAAQLAGSLNRLLREVKLALGLRTVDRRLGHFCPLHDAPLVELVAPGDVGTLRYARLDRQGRPVGPSVSWVHTDAVLCRSCGASWTPDRYVLLGRMLRQADARRLAAMEGERDATRTE